MKSLRVFWGILLLCLGLLFLGRNVNFISSEILWHLLFYWPIIILLFGLGLVLRNVWAYLAVSVLVLAGVFYFAYADPFHWQKENSPARQAENTPIPNITENYDGTIKSFKLTLDLGAAVVDLKNLNDADSSNALLKGNYTGIEYLEALRENKDGIATLNLKEKGPTKEYIKNSGTVRSLNAGITNKLPVEFVANSGASRLNLDLSGINLTKLEVNAGASNIAIKLGDKAENIDAKVSCGASKVNIAVPKDFGLKLDSTSFLAGKNYSGINLEKDNDQSYHTPGYDQAKKKIDISLSAGVSKLNISQY